MYCNGKTGRMIITTQIYDNGWDYMQHIIGQKSGSSVSLIISPTEAMLYVDCYMHTCIPEQ